MNNPEWSKGIFFCFSSARLSPLYPSIPKVTFSFAIINSTMYVREFLENFETYVNRFQEAECFDLALIHDTRTGAGVSLPHVKSIERQREMNKNNDFCLHQGADCLDKYGFGVTDVPLISRWLSIYYGNNYGVSDLQIVHFCFKTQAIAKVEERLCVCV